MDAINGIQYMFVLTILEKNQISEINILSIFLKVKLTNTQLNKLKSAAKNKTGTILRLTKKNVEDEKLPYQLFLTSRQTTKIRNVFASNMSTDKKT